MAKMTFELGDDFAMKISQLGAASNDVAKKAIYAGAKIVADEVRRRINAMPTDHFRFLREGEKFSGVPSGQKNDLLAGMGITPIQVDKNGDWNAKVGFDGYGSAPTKKYPKGLPNQLLARAIESGSSVRVKRPFMRPAFNAAKDAAVREMERSADEEIKRIMGV